jgi:nicotinate-nucleotide pyrophosphorylase (carboxylating)
VHKEVEVDRLDQIEPVLAADVDTIMLDNFSIDDLRIGVQQIAGRALVEASGGISLERVREIANTGVDLISIGALTHSVRSIDLGLDFVKS